MTDDIQKWVDSAKEIDRHSYFDGCGNICRKAIYKKKGKYYEVEFFMTKPHGKPHEVKPKKVTKTEWIRK